MLRILWVLTFLIMIEPGSCVNISVIANFIRHFDLVYPLTIKGPFQVKLNLAKHFFGNHQYVVFEDMDKRDIRVCGQEQHTQTWPNCIGGKEFYDFGHFKSLNIRQCPREFDLFNQ